MVKDGKEKFRNTSFIIFLRVFKDIFSDITFTNTVHPHPAILEYDGFVGIILRMRSSGKTKDIERKVPRPIIIEVTINGHAARALIDTGSLADFMSTTLVDQLKIKTETLKVPLTVQLAVVGSKSKINHCCTAEFEYQGIKEKRSFDVLNLDDVDIILGTPWLFQHLVLVGFNPSQLKIGNDLSVPIEGENVGYIKSSAMRKYSTAIEDVRDMLLNEVQDLCKSAEETPLPPLRVINHQIPLIDEKKSLPYRTARCPEALRPLWNEKCATYQGLGKWREAVIAADQTVPLLVILKKPGPNGELRIRTVLDKGSLNDNTVKMASPLPDVDGILRRVASKNFRSLIDGKDASSPSTLIERLSIRLVEQ